MTDTAEAAPAAPAAASAATSNTEYSFEEFKMMYESTECVSDRKIAFMRNNSQLCVAIIAGQGIAASWSFENREVEWVIAFTIMVIGTLGVFFCRYWSTQLAHLIALNAAKFDVLEEMANYVVFPDYKQRTIRSKNPFFREYQIMEDKKKVVQKGDRKTPTAAEAEKEVPRGFLLFFALSVAFSAVWLASEIIQLWSNNG